MSREFIEALAWALIHFTWQGALVALAAALACTTLGTSRPQARYAVLVAALAVMAVTPMATTGYLLVRPHAASLMTGLPVSAIAVAVADRAPATAATTLMSVPSPSGSSWLAALVASWSGIAAFLSLRSFGGWLRIQQLARRNTIPAGRAVEECARRLCDRLGIRGAVRVVRSAVAEVPGVVGWLRPVILLPVSVVTALTPEQIAQILAHELAHVRRHDYLVNLFQTAVENVLFYHPAVWWISGQVRVEREHCCDDLAVATFGDATAYARTLAQLETLRGAAAPALLPAATGGSLLARVRRVLGHDASRRAAPAWLGAVVPLAIVVLALVSVPPPKANADAAPPPEPAPVARPAPASRAGITPAPAPVAMAAPRSVADVTPAPESRPDAGVTPAPAPAPRPEAQPAAQPAPAPVAQPAPKPIRGGYLAGLANAGYTDVSVDDIITLKNHGVEPSYIKGMLGAGLGNLGVDQLVRLREHGVPPEFASSVVASGLASGLDVEKVIRLHDNGVSPEDMRRIRALGFGPYAVEDVIRLRHNGVNVPTFEALKEVSGPAAPAEHAIQFRVFGVTPETVREAQRQGFKDLTYEQILKLHRAGVI